jgi:hypothetical protein
MQTIKFLRNFFTKGFKIHSRFYRILSDFFKNLKFSKFRFFKI